MLWHKCGREAAFVRQCSPALQPQPLDAKRVKMV
jgi:hypothetical protein